MNVVVTGTLGFDYIMNFSGRFADRIMPDKIHKLSLSFLVDTLNKQFGGTAGNVAYMLKLLGVEPTIVAPVGNDFAPYKKFLQSKKISTKGIAIHQDVATSAYFVMTDKEDNQIGSFFMGATKYAKDLSIGSALPYENFVVLGPTETQAMVLTVKECRLLSLPYLYDPAFQIAMFSSDELREGIGGAAILIGNDYEIALIEDRLDISHEELILMVPVLVTTIGKKGSIIETRHDAIRVKPAKPKNESDPTGAGDAYRAGFLAGYLRYARFPESKKFGFRESVVTGDELLVCGQMGSVAAVYTVETYGTQTHTFTKKEFINRYKENFDHTITL